MASKVGEPYLETNAERDLERLDRLGVFSSVTFQAIAEGDEVVLQIEVRETFPYIPMLSIEITEENGTAVGPGLRSVNLLGRAISLSASARFGGQTVLEVRAETPWYASAKMAYQGAFVYRDRFDEVYEFEENSIDFEFGLGRRVGEAGRYGALFNFLSLGSDTPGVTLSPSNEDNVPTLGAFVGYDSRDLISNPRGGWWNEFQISKSGLFGGDGNFWTFIIDARRFQPIALRHILAVFSLATMRTGTVGTDVPVYLQFNLGGTNTIRGWSLASSNGKNQFINTAEYRYTLMTPRDGKVLGLTGYLSLQLVAFGDLGSAWNDSDQVLQELHWRLRVRDPRHHSIREHGALRSCVGRVWGRGERERRHHGESRDAAAPGEVVGGRLSSAACFTEPASSVRGMRAIGRERDAVLGPSQFT